MVLLRATSNNGHRFPHLPTYAHSHARLLENRESDRPSLHPEMMVHEQATLDEGSLLHVRLRDAIQHRVRSSHPLREYATDSMTA